MLYPLITLGLLAAFVGYIIYSAIYKRNLRSQMTTIVYPGLFFIGVWLIVYFTFLR